MALNTQKERIHQLFFSLGKDNKALAFELAKTIDYYEDFLETIYQRLLDIPHFEDAIFLFREIHKEQEANENIPIPTGLKLKESYVHSFFENYLQEQVYLEHV